MYLLKAVLFVCFLLQVSALVLDKRTSMEPRYTECNYPKIKHYLGYTFSVYTENNCGGKHETFYGGWPFCECYTMNLSGIKAFNFATNHEFHRLDVYPKPNCMGTHLGSSAGAWSEPYVSPKAQKMRSFKVCPYSPT
ncbi:hypothetical protein BV22DRAFT_1029681 [Leucogyrophana mollusca]|uniref:Uncharacterized protein n=1 Tax=Leucogyrophana mollusca TaxID=85980 RepID=A0ACB8BV12_9AGAM|nr:hypothetical protein BV22DRAFT_1029681 [Leucogyrophana mollusca]